MLLCLGKSCQFTFHSMSMIYPYDLQPVTSVVFIVIFWGLYKEFFLHLVPLRMLLGLRKRKKKEVALTFKAFHGEFWLSLQLSHFWIGNHLCELPVQLLFQAKYLYAFSKDPSVRYVFPQDSSHVFPSNSLALPFVIAVTKTLTTRSLVCYDHYPSTEQLCLLLLYALSLPLVYFIAAKSEGIEEHTW